MLSHTPGIINNSRTNIVGLTQLSHLHSHTYLVAPTTVVSTTLSTLHCHTYIVGQTMLLVLCGPNKVEQTK